MFADTKSDFFFFFFCYFQVRAWFFFFFSQNAGSQTRRPEVHSDRDKAACVNEQFVCLLNP